MREMKESLNKQRQSMILSLEFQDANAAKFDHLIQCNFCQNLSKTLKDLEKKIFHSLYRRQKIQNSQ